jgi:hypothetical protein
LGQADEVLQKQVACKATPQEKLHGKAVQEDYSGAAMVQTRLGKNVMPLGGESEDEASRVLPAGRRQELGQRLEHMLKQKDYAGAAALQDEIKSLGQADEVHRKQATRKVELQQQLDEKLVQKDYAGAAMIQEQLKEDCMPVRSAGEGATSSVLPTLRMQELGQRFEEARGRCGASGGDEALGTS